MDLRAGAPAAGWYPDAARPGTARWWDGAGWTEHSVLIESAVPETADRSPAAAHPSHDAAHPGPEASVAPSASPEAPLSRRERRALDEALPIASGSSAPVVAPPFATPGTSIDESAVSPDPFHGEEAWAPVAAAPAAAIPVPGGPTTADPVADESATTTTTEAAQLAQAAPPLVGTDAPASALAPGWPVLPQLAVPDQAFDIASADYQPMARTYPSSAAAPPYLLRGPLSTATVGAWALAMLPLVIGAALAAVILLLVLPDPDALLMTGTVPVALAGIGLGTFVWTILFSALDRRRLGALGHDRRPSILWAVLLGPFAYFIVRVIVLRESGRRAAAPLIGYVVALLLVAIGSGIAVGVGAASLTTVSAIGSIESSLAASLEQQGLPYTVLCPSGIDLVEGAVLVCEARDEIGVAALVEVTITDPAGEFSYRMV